MKAIINAELVMRDHLIPEAVLFVEDGVITGFGQMRSTPIPEDCEILDAKGLYVGPGLVDIHCHAGDHKRFEEDPITAAKVHLRNGTTTILATMGYRLSVDQYRECIDRVREAMGKPQGANIGGIYMEGPFINPNYGSNAHLNPWAGRGVQQEDYEPILEKLGDLVKVWAVAPELDDIEAFVKAAKKSNPAVRFAVGHSESTPQQIEALMPYGLCIGTHHTNATGTIVKYPECRGVCVDEAVNYHREIYAELICDKKGIHVDPYMLRLVRRIKGDDRIILISDSTVGKGPVPGPGYEGADDINFDMVGEISGTKNTLYAVCYNMMVHTGASIVDVFRFGSANPAKAVGFTDRGEIRRGLRADLVIVDGKLNVKTVILKGAIQ